jgi:hypothetical protein
MTDAGNKDWQRRTPGELVQMKISAPKQITMWIAVILAIIGVLPMLGVAIAGLTTIMAWCLPVGFIVLLAGVLFEGI